MTRSEIAEQLRTQDNLATAEPIFYVKDKERVYGMDPDGDEAKRAWVLIEDATVEADEVLSKELDEWYRSIAWGHHGSDKGYSKTWRPLYYVERDVVVQPFFTRAGAERYIEENKHNLRRPFIYVDAAVRNSEWQEARRMFANPLDDEIFNDLRIKIATLKSAIRMALPALTQLAQNDGHGDNDWCPHSLCTDGESCDGGEGCQCEPKGVGCDGDCFQKQTELARDALAVLRALIKS